MLRVECGQNIDPSRESVDAHSGGADWRTHAPSPEIHIALFAFCPKGEDLTISLTPEGLTLTDIQGLTRAEAEAKLLNASSYYCHRFGTRTCPLYQNPTPS